MNLRALLKDLVVMFKKHFQPQKAVVLGELGDPVLILLTTIAQLCDL